MLVKTRQCLVERRTSVASERDIGDTGILLTCINDEASMRMKLEVSDRFYPAFHFKLAMCYFQAVSGCNREAPPVNDLVKYNNLQIYAELQVTGGN